MTGVLLVFMLGAIGCGKRESVNHGPEGMYNLRSVAKAYTVTAARVRPPKCVEDIMPVLREIGNPEELLRSVRDGKPYTIVWGIDIRQPMAGTAPVIACEQQGKDGKRQAIDLKMKVREYTAEEFAALKLPQSPESPK